MFLLSTDIVNNQKSLLHIRTHCDKKPCGKVGGSVISVYQALLHSPTESLGTRLAQVWLLLVIFANHAGLYSGTLKCGIPLDRQRTTTSTERAYQCEGSCTKPCIAVLKISLVLRHVPAPILVQSTQGTGASVNIGTGYDMGLHYTYHLHGPKLPDISIEDNRLA